MPRRPLRASFNGSRGTREPEKGFKNHAISRPSEFGGGRTNDDDGDDDGVSSYKGKARNSLSNGARTDRRWWIEKKRKGVKGTLLTISFPSLNRFRRDPSFSYDWIFLSRPSLLTIINKEGCFVDVGKACAIRVIRSLSTFILLHPFLFPRSTTSYRVDEKLFPTVHSSPNPQKRYLVAYETGS